MKNFRPFPISPIRNNFLRRVLMIISFIPLLILAVFISTAVHFVSLSQSLVEFWYKPREVSDTDE